MTSLEALDSPLVLVLTRDSIKSIPSREALLKLLKIHILELPMGLIRDIEQRARLSQKLCDGYHKTLETNEISVFPAPLSTHQNDTRILAPRHLAHLVSATIPQIEPDMPEAPSTATVCPNEIRHESTEDLAPEPPARKLELLDQSPPDSTHVAAAPVSAALMVTKQVSPASPWRRFLQAIRLALALIALTISLSPDSPLHTKLTMIASSHEASPPKSKQTTQKSINRPSTQGSSQVVRARTACDKEHHRLDREETTTCGAARNIQPTKVALKQAVEPGFPLRRLARSVAVHAQIRGPARPAFSIRSRPSSECRPFLAKRSIQRPQPIAEWAWRNLEKTPRTCSSWLARKLTSGIFPQRGVVARHEEASYRDMWPTNNTASVSLCEKNDYGYFRASHDGLRS